MRSPSAPCAARPRGGATTVELAVLLPFLCFLFVVAVDYARIFYFAVTLENCARNGAYYASNYPNSNYVYNDIYGYKTVDDAVLKDASNLYDTTTGVGKPTYTVKYGADENGPFGPTQTSSTKYVHVTVNWTFDSITGFPGIPQQVNLSRAVTMRMSPAMPKFSTGGGSDDDDD